MMLRSRILLATAVGTVGLVALTGPVTQASAAPHAPRHTVTQHATPGARPTLLVRHALRQSSAYSSRLVIRYGAGHRPAVPTLTSRESIMTPEPGLLASRVRHVTTMCGTENP